ncbi:ML domain-containing protein [Entophlyctis helioformis]|nr:ML domain-containing protein [Entophlyctis helioformis]
MVMAVGSTPFASSPCVAAVRRSCCLVSLSCLAALLVPASIVETPPCRRNKVCAASGMLFVSQSLVATLACTLIALSAAPQTQAIAVGGRAVRQGVVKQYDLLKQQPQVLSLQTLQEDQGAADDQAMDAALAKFIQQATEAAKRQKSGGKAGKKSDSDSESDSDDEEEAATLLSLFRSSSSKAAKAAKKANKKADRKGNKGSSKPAMLLAHSSRVAAQEAAQPKSSVGALGWWWWQTPATPPAAPAPPAPAPPVTPPARIPTTPPSSTLDSTVNCGLDGDVLTLESFVLNPDPPQRGAPLAFALNGTLSEPLVAGAKVRVTVKLGFIQILDSEYDLCEQVGAVDLECPVPEGPLAVQKAFDIPRELPPGKYKIHIDVSNADTKHVACLQSEFRM